MNLRSNFLTIEFNPYLFKTAKWDEKILDLRKEAVEKGGGKQ